jgi:osmoprotectant transport system permease protein
VSFWNYLLQNWPAVLQHLREHVRLVSIATLIAVAIGVPTGILLTRKKSLRGPVLGIANVMQTIPSLALFGFLIPLPFIGGIGARTAIVALVLYSLLPIIRNTVTGILGVDPNVREAAVAMGMTGRQVLWQVELPLAMSVIITGVRVALVIAIGVATIAAAVGADGLGVFIFRGIRQFDNNLLLAGAVPAALLALTADFVLGLVERSFATEDNKKARGARKALTWMAIVALTGGIAYVAFATALKDVRPAAKAHVVVGSKDFTESAILAEIVAQLLEARGVVVERKFELGGNLPHDALLGAQIDLYPEYTGTSYTAILKHDPITDPRAVYDQVKQEYAEKFKVAVSEPLGFDNTFAILVRGAEARRLQLHTISDAVPYARNWRAGFGQDFMSRADGYPGFVKAYGFKFVDQPREMDLSLTYIALASGQIDLIAGNSTEGRIAKLDLFQLEDDRHYFPPYEGVYLVRQDSLVRVPALNDVLTKLAHSISTEEMRQLNYEVDGNKRGQAEVVREWLMRKGFVAGS